VSPIVRLSIMFSGAGSDDKSLAQNHEESKSRRNLDSSHARALSQKSIEDLQKEIPEKVQAIDDEIHGWDQMSPHVADFNIMKATRVLLGKGRFLRNYVEELTRHRTGALIDISYWRSLLHSSELKQYVCLIQVSRRSLAAHAIPEGWKDRNQSRKNVRSHLEGARGAVWAMMDTRLDQWLAQFGNEPTAADDRAQIADAWVQAESPELAAKEISKIVTKRTGRDEQNYLEVDSLLVRTTFNVKRNLEKLKEMEDCVEFDDLFQDRRYT
jgi:hypothetical protein